MMKLNLYGIGQGPGEIAGNISAVIKVNNEDYFCLTDMIKAKDGDFFVTDWLKNRNTLEYLGVWERVYNPLFNYGEFALINNWSTTR